MSEVEKTCENCEYEHEDTEGTHCRHCIHNAEEKFKQKAYYDKKIECMDDVIERLQYKADNIRAKLEPSYFIECIDYLKNWQIVVAEKYDEGHEDGYSEGYLDGMIFGDWIPCSERLPKEGQCVLVQKVDESMWDEETNIQVRKFDTKHNGYCWKDIEIDSWDIKDSVVAWMPLPEIYKGGMKDA